MKILYAITHVNKDGFRILTFTNQGRNHFESREAAERKMKPYKAVDSELRSKILGDLADTLEVWAIKCYDNGDAAGIYKDCVKEK